MNEKIIEKLGNEPFIELAKTKDKFITSRKDSFYKPEFDLKIKLI
jgi:hypothetical protein